MCCISELLDEIPVECLRVNKEDFDKKPMRLRLGCLPVQQFPVPKGCQYPFAAGRHRNSHPEGRPCHGY